MNFPVEIWEHIIQFCDGRTLIALQRSSWILKNLIYSLNKRRQIWHSRCHSEIPGHELADIYHVLCQRAPSWESIFGIWCRWKNIANWGLGVVKLSGSYSSITDVKISGVMMVIGDKVGFTILNSAINARKTYKIGAVKHVELYCSSNAVRPDGSQFKHDKLDCTLFARIHYFFDVHRSRHLRKETYEQCLIRYSRHGLDRLVMDRKFPETDELVIEADIFNSRQLIVGSESLTQKVGPVIIHYMRYSFEEARCWFSWQARLFMFANENAFHVFLDGRMEKMFFQGFPRISAIYYFCGVLVLGTAHGTVYIYSVDLDEIMNLHLESYVVKVDVCKEPIAAVRVMEDGCKVNECIVVCTDKKIYRIFS